MEAAGPAGLVTGAASGLGRAVVASLRRQGWRTVGVDLAGDAGSDLTVVADVTDSDALQAAVANAVDRLGGLDGVAACAGVNARTFALAEHLPRADWDRLLSVNLTGSFLTAQAVLPHLARRGGALVLVSSVSAHDPLPGAAHYSAAKAGIVALARSLALEYGRAGVRVNSVAPGYMDTPMSAPVLDREAVRRQIEAAIPLGRVAAPEEVAEVVAWLLGPGAGYLTGQDLVVDGGLGLTAYSNPRMLERLWTGETS